jgi:ABC-type glycerol-3-phosphate transport system substrate-binding protein
MIQQGSVMNNGNRVAINNKESKNALTFYTEFAKTSSPLYSWNYRMHNSLDAFSEGRLAMMFNYSWQMDVIKKKSPKLNFGVASVPQVPNKLRVNYANYWGYGVSKNKIIQADPTTASDTTIAPTTDAVRVAEAWRLLKFMSTKAGAADYVVGGTQILDPTYDAAFAYAEKTGKPAARRDIIETQKANPSIGVFAEQNLFAKSWKQLNPELIEGMMVQMINHVVSGEQTADEAIRSTELQINQALGQ